ncbi:hypothetical protein L195_g055056 [Trifolium pratense]|uniref:Uncharacterized protein n=1 Tax=Trifolium pratense TaxID=57577 RepID=A0A2K3KJA5_TRIPR|nr:hypothetical protein L195_g055056 [Trifolium pratense]
MEDGGDLAEGEMRCCGGWEDGCTRLEGTQGRGVAELDPDLLFDSLEVCEGSMQG